MAADSVDSAAAVLFFSEAEPGLPRPEAPVPVVDLARAVPVPSPRHAVPAHHAKRPIIWLGIGLAVSVSVIWITDFGSDRTNMPRSARSSPPPSVPAAPIVLAPAPAPPPQIDRVQPAVVSPRVENPSVPAPAVKRDRPRSRDDARGTTQTAREVGVPAPTRTSPGFRGAIVVDSDPVGARVFVNGEPVGSTPVVLPDVPVGSRVVRIEADGYEHWSSAIRVVANQETRVAATLRR